MWPYYAVAGFLLIPAIIDSATNRRATDLLRSRGAQWLFLTATILLVLMVGLRGSNVDRDYRTYEDFIRAEATGPIVAPRTLVLHEPTEVLFAAIVGRLSLPVWLFFLAYAVIGVAGKARLIAKHSDWPWLSLFLYACHFFILHDMTQVRAGAAGAIALLALPLLLERRLTAYVLAILAAGLFHYSALVMLLPIVFDGKRLNTSLWAVLLLSAVVAAAVGIGQHTLLRFSQILPGRAATYATLFEQGKYAALHLWNVMFVLQLLANMTLIGLFERHIEPTDLSVLTIKIYTMSSIAFLLLRSIPVIAFRVSEFYGLVQILLWPLLITAFRQKTVVTLCIVGLGLFQLTANLFNQNLIGPYDVHSLP